MNATQPDLDLEATLQKAIRAAKRGYAEPARRLLMQVLKADPRNEEAWLWLSRVADTPRHQEQCLKRVLVLNPENQWAKERLVALQSPPPVPASAEPVAEAAAKAKSTQAVGHLSQQDAMHLEQITCPNCQAAFDLHGGTYTKTAVCRYCGQVLSLSGEQIDIVGKGRQMHPAKPIKLGMEAAFEKERYQVIGWLRYEGWDDEEHWRWDEWLLASSSGQFRWLSYDKEAGFALQRKITPQVAFNPRVAQIIPIPGVGNVLVSERSPARIIAVDGELTWRANVGEQLNYLEAAKGKGRYTVEYTDDEIELFAGQAVPEVDVWRAFGKESLAKKAEAHEGVKQSSMTLTVLCALFAFIAFTASVIVGTSGRDIFQQQVVLRAGAVDQRIGPLRVTVPNRPHRITLRSGGLPVNTWAYVEVTASDPQENEFALVAAEFWDEEGRDSEGYWHESDLKHQALFRPDTAGDYDLYVVMEEATTTSMRLTLTIEDKAWVASYYVYFTVICGVLAFIFYSRAQMAFATDLED